MAAIVLNDRAGDQISCVVKALVDLDGTLVGSKFQVPQSPEDETLADVAHVKERYNSNGTFHACLLSSLLCDLIAGTTYTAKVYRTKIKESLDALKEDVCDKSALSVEASTLSTLINFFVGEAEIRGANKFKTNSKLKIWWNAVSTSLRNSQVVMGDENAYRCNVPLRFLFEHAEQTDFLDYCRQIRAEDILDSMIQNGTDTPDGGTHSIRDVDEDSSLWLNRLNNSWQTLRNALSSLLNILQKYFNQQIDINAVGKCLGEVAHLISGGDRARWVRLAPSYHRVHGPLRELVRPSVVLALNADDNGAVPLSQLQKVERLASGNDLPTDLLNVRIIYSPVCYRCDSGFVAGSMTFAIVSNERYVDIEEAHPTGWNEQEWVLVAMVGEVAVSLSEEEEYNNFKARNRSSFVYIDQSFRVRSMEIATAYVASHSQGECLCILGEAPVEQNYSPGHPTFQGTSPALRLIVQDGTVVQWLQRQHRRLYEESRLHLRIVYVLLALVILAVAYLFFTQQRSNHESTNTSNFLSTNVSITNGATRKYYLDQLIVLQREIADNRPLNAFELSISMIQKISPPIREYVCVEDTPHEDGIKHYWQSRYWLANETMLAELDELRTCINISSIYCEQHFVEGYEWSFRLAVFMIHRYTWDFIDKQLQPYLLNLPPAPTTMATRFAEKTWPTCYNPLSAFNATALRLAGEEGGANIPTMVSAMRKNLEFHLSVGFNYRVNN